ncbi:MAG TPA: twin-arginine translocase TatA/TatE family subunit [Gemmatimonadaceae bacterium]
MNFGNLGFMEILLILVVVLLLFGAKRLPEIGASFGRTITSFKRGLNEVDRSIREADTQPRVGSSDAAPAARAEEESRPEPRRLLS